MIPVNKNLTNIPPSLKSADCIANLNMVVASSNKQLLQRFYAEPDVVKRLKRIYNNKCAYCETFEPEPEIEHYRPKKRVKDVVHDGYYWLAYEWSNLLPACHDCNKTGVKGNHFPIEGVRVNNAVLKGGLLCKKSCKLASVPLSQEMALFLNPEAPGFDPFNYFKFSEVGEIQESPRNTTFDFRRAKKTIEIVALNRDKLFANYRMKQLDELKKSLKLILLQFLASNFTEPGLKAMYFDILTKIKSKSNPKREYSFFWSFVYLNWDFYLNHFLRRPYRQRFIDYTTEYKSLNP